MLLFVKLTDKLKIGDVKWNISFEIYNLNAKLIFAGYFRFDLNLMFHSRKIEKQSRRHAISYLLKNATSINNKVSFKKIIGLNNEYIDQYSKILKIDDIISFVE